MMKPVHRISRTEAKIQDDIIRMFRHLGWFCKETHGNLFQAGFPDVFCTHTSYGHRWIEVKDPKRTGDIFTPAQHIVFPQLCANGSGVWVMTAATVEEYDKVLKGRPNWIFYLSVWTKKL